MDFNFDNLPIITIIINKDENIIYCNKKVNQILYTPHELIGNKLNIIFTKSLNHRNYLNNYSNSEYSQIIDKGREVNVKCKNGDIKKFYLNVSPFYIKEEIYFCGTLCFIRECKTIDNAMYYYKIMNSNENIIISKMSITEITILEITDSVKKILGYLPNELIGKKGTDFIHSDDVDKFLSNIEIIEKTGNINEKCIFRKKRKSGDYIWIESHIVGIENNVVLYIEKDITEEIHNIETMKLKELELSKEEQKIHLEAEKNKSKKEFMQYVFHEARGWMNTITLGLDTCISILKNNEKLSKLLSDLQIANSNIIKIFNDTLTLQKLENGDFDYEMYPFYISKLISSSKEGVRCLLEPKKIELIVHPIEEILEKKILVGDIFRLSQCLRNYLSNAIKFSEFGSKIEMKTEIIKLEVEIITVKFTVSDFGCGIKDEDKSKIFKEFQQIRAGALQNAGGSGLGLSIVKQFVENGHHGQVGFESTYNKGSSFYMIIPFSISENSPVTPKKFNKNTELLNKCFFEELFEQIDFNCDVLIVEDVFLTRKMMTRFFQTKFITFDCAENGLEAVNKIKLGNKYKIILMDKEMPIMDGFEATKKIRNLGYTLPIIGLTGNAFEEQQKDFIDVGANAVLIKPLDLNQFDEIRLRFNF
jgi:PAS domain S-box-containing protein